MDIGTDVFVVVGGFAPGGLNVNNNYDNDNNGVAALRKSCYFPYCIKKLSGERTSTIRPPFFQFLEGSLGEPSIAGYQLSEYLKPTQSIL